MGVREIEQSLGQWELGVKDVQRTTSDAIGAHAKGTGAVVRHPAAGPGMVSFSGNYDPVDRGIFANYIPV